MLRRLTPTNWLTVGLVLVSCWLAFAPGAKANPAVRSDSLTIYPNWTGSQARGEAYGAERVDARIYYYGYYHSWVGCYRSSWSVHLWICNGTGGVPPGNGAFAQIAYWNWNGWSYGYSPWVLSSCCETHSATSATLG